MCSVATPRGDSKYLSPVTLTQIQFQFTHMTKGQKTSIKLSNSTGFAYNTEHRVSTVKKKVKLKKLIGANVSVITY